MPPLQDEPTTTWPPREVVLPVNLLSATSMHPLQDQEIPKVVVKKPRSVRFEKSVQIHPVLCRQDLTPEEKAKVWMDGFDRRENKRDITNTIFLMRSGLTNKLTEEDFFCPRGLEHLVNCKSNHEQRDASCKTSIRIALAMQRVLRKAGASNPVLIARAYRKYTIKSKQVAYKKALYDEAFASWSHDQGKTCGGNEQDSVAQSL